MICFSCLIECRHSCLPDKKRPENLFWVLISCRFVLEFPKVRPVTATSCTYPHAMRSPHNRSYILAVNSNSVTVTDCHVESSSELCIESGRVRKGPIAPGPTSSACKRFSTISYGISLSETVLGRPSKSKALLRKASRFGETDFICGGRFYSPPPSNR